MKEYIIGPGDEGIRLDKQLLKILNNAGSGFVYRMLRKKNITLNDRKASGNEHLSSGDVIKIFLSDETFEKFSGKNKTDELRAEDKAQVSGSINEIIIHEDEDLLIVNKPSGLLTQKAFAQDISLNEMCLSYLTDKGEISDETLKMFKPSVCNRLDRNTSGIVIFAKNYRAASTISRALKERTIHKYYLCIVKGRVNKEGRETAYLVKDIRSNRVRVSDTDEKGASVINTLYRPLRTADGYSLLEVELITGKSHQIRAQMAHIGHPLIGDYKYGDKKLNDDLKDRFNISSQVLHAYKLVIPDKQGEDTDRYARTYIAPPPEYMKELIEELFSCDMIDLR
ncbi:MAG: RluA family pseudouridine synthase [Lachnospiraceae bacterium]|nr:RluA family pseudouridine synthase [Lachnospiraceae bacterium]